MDVELSSIWGSVLKDVLLENNIRLKPWEIELAKHLINGNIDKYIYLPRNYFK